MSVSLDPQTRPLGWAEIHRNSKKLAARLAGKGPFKGLLAIARGGAVPAALLAYDLDMHVIETTTVAGYSDYDGAASVPVRGEAVQVLKEAVGLGDGTGWLVVDDLVDTGRTIAFLREKYPKAFYVTLYAKPKGAPFVDLYIEDLPQDLWVYFPWEPQPEPGS